MIWGRRDRPLPTRHGPVLFGKLHRISVMVNDLDVMLCQVGFLRDGYFVSWPYHPDSDGIAGRVELASGTGQYSFDLKDLGRVTSHKVKFSHHIDGNAHISQGGKVVTAVRAKAITLDKPIEEERHVFTVCVTGLAAFTQRDNNTASFACDHMPNAVTLVGRWHPRPLPDGLLNPVECSGPKGRGKRSYFACAPPRTSTFGGVIFLSGYEEQPDMVEPNGLDFSVSFIAGFSEGADDIANPATFIGLAYPVTEAGGIPSMDWIGPAAVTNSEERRRQSKRGTAR